MEAIITIQEIGGNPKLEVEVNLTDSVKSLVQTANEWMNTRKRSGRGGMSGLAFFQPITNKPLDLMQSEYLTMTLGEVGIVDGSVVTARES